MHLMVATHAPYSVVVTKTAGIWSPSALDHSTSPTYTVSNWNCPSFMLRGRGGAGSGSGPRRRTQPVPPRPVSGRRLARRVAAGENRGDRTAPLVTPPAHPGRQRPHTPEPVPGLGKLPGDAFTRFGRPALIGHGQRHTRRPPPY